MFCIMDLLLNGIKRNTEIHAPQTHTSQIGNRLLAHGGHESYTCQSLPQPAGKDEDDMSSVSLAPPAKLWTCWWAPMAVSRSDLASELQTCLSNFLMDISTYFSKNSAFLKLTSWTILFLHLIPTFLVVGVQFSSVAQLCPTLCNPVNRSMPGLPVHHRLPESTQTHVHRVGDAIQPSHPLSSPSPSALNLSHHQGLF